MYVLGEIEQAMEEYADQFRQPVVSESLSPIVPTEIRIMEKARQRYGKPPYTDGEEVAFAEGARWMKKMLVGDNDSLTYDACGRWHFKDRIKLTDEYKLKN